MMEKFRNILVMLAGVTVLCISLRSLLNSSFFPIHDFTHVTRLVEMDTAIKDGHIPPRWSKHLGYGYGMPLFTFYGPLPFFLADIFYSIGFSAITSVKMIVVLAGVLGFAGMYLLTKSFFGRASAVLSATLFVFMPYRALDIFVRGAFNEVFAISCIPWILLGIEHLRTSKPWKMGVLIVTIGLVGLFTSHNLMTFMFFPMILVYAFFRLIGVSDRKRTISFLFLSIVTSVLLSSFYLFPSFLEKDFTQVDKLISGYGEFKYHFLYIRQLFTGEWGYGGSILGIEDDMGYMLGWPQVLLAGVGSIAWIQRKKLDQRIAGIGVGFITVAALFMTIFKSSFLWEQLPFVSYIQFPWRFLSISTVTLPILAAAALTFIPKKNKRILVAIACCTLTILFVGAFHQPRGIMDNTDGVYFTDPARISKEMSGILPDYIPKTVQTIPDVSTERVGVSYGSLPETYKKIVDRTHEILVYFQTQKPVPLVFRVFDFPGWTVYDNGKKVDHQRHQEFGTIEVTIPPGEHHVALRFEETPVRYWSNFASIMGLLVLIGIGMYARHPKH